MDLVLIPAFSSQILTGVHTNLSRELCETPTAGVFPNAASQSPNFSTRAEPGAWLHIRRKGSNWVLLSKRPLLINQTRLLFLWSLFLTKDDDSRKVLQLNPDANSFCCGALAPPPLRAQIGRGGGGRFLENHAKRDGRTDGRSVGEPGGRGTEGGAAPPVSIPDALPPARRPRAAAAQLLQMSAVFHGSCAAQRCQMALGILPLLSDSA